MNEPAILHDLTDVFRKVLDNPDIELGMDTTADDVPEWDSMNHIFITVEVERRFGIKFRSAEMEELKNVGDLVHLIQARTEKAS